MVTDTVPVQLGPPAVVHGTASGLATVSAAPLPAAAPAVRTASADVPVRAGRLLPPLLRVESRSIGSVQRSFASLAVSGGSLASALLAFSRKKVSMKSLTTLNKDKIN